MCRGATRMKRRLPNPRYDDHKTTLSNSNSQDPSTRTPKPRKVGDAQPVDMRRQTSTKNPSDRELTPGVLSGKWHPTPLTLVLGKKREERSIWGAMPNGFAWACLRTSNPFACPRKAVGHGTQKRVNGVACHPDLETLSRKKVIGVARQFLRQGGCPALSVDRSVGRQEKRAD
jgi:hypothetical protein